MSLVMSLPVIGLDQVLRTPGASFAAQPGTEVQDWITDSLMAVPFFAAGIWAGDLIAGRAMIGVARLSDLLKRSLIIALLSGLAVTPVWFVINKIDNPVRAQPLVFPTAHDSGDVYSVAPAVIIALVCVTLVPAAFWSGRGIARAVTRNAPAVTGGGISRAAVVRAAVPALLAAAVPVLAWLMYRAAAHAYATQVYYARGTLPAAHHLRSASLAATASRSSPPHVRSAPGALVSQTAHALQDGLAGQAAGIPVVVLAAAALARASTAKTSTARQPAARTPQAHLPHSRQTSHEERCRNGQTPDHETRPV
jgi:hypothetical protein